MLFTKDIKPKKEEAGKAKGRNNTGRRRRANRRFQGQRRKTINTASKFKGDTEELHRHVYNCGKADQSDLFTTTTKKVANNADWHYKEAQDIQQAINELKHITLAPPLPRNIPNVDQKMLDALMNKDLDMFVKWESMYQQTRQKYTRLY